MPASGAPEASSHAVRVFRHPSRSRLVCAALVLLTVALGLGSRHFGSELPRFLAAYVGDALWAAMVFWLAAGTLPRVPTSRLAAGTFAFAVAVEVSQLYQAPWVGAIRATRLGALVLGHGFLWSDLACYAAGVAIAALLDRAFVAQASVEPTAGLHAT